MKMKAWTMTTAWLRSGMGQALVLSLLACSRAGEIGQADIDGLRLVLRSDPAPLVVGQGTRIEADLHRPNGQPVSACRLELQRSMPGMAMTSDADRIPLDPTGEGLYAATIDQFGMGGDWRLTITVACRGGKPSTAVFDVRIPWPE